MLMKPKKVVRKSRDWLDPKLLLLVYYILFGVGRLVYTSMLFDEGI